MRETRRRVQECQNSHQASLFSLLLQPPNIHTQIIQTSSQRNDVLNTVGPASLDTTVNIPSQTINNHSPLFPTAQIFHPEYLTSASAPVTFNTILPVATTDQQQQTWLPSVPKRQPATHSPLLPPHQNPEQDFQLFDSAVPHRAPNQIQQQALASQHRRHSSNQTSASALQNQRVASIIQNSGHSISTASLTRFSPAQHQQFYASSAPSSTTTLQQQRQTRPQVPLFSASTSQVPQTPSMSFQGEYFRDSSASSVDSQQTDVDLFGDEMFEGAASTQTAFHSMYDVNANLSSSSTSTTNMATVSPQELQLRDSFASAPNSTAFTNLTSPSTYNESPEYTDNFDVSPFVGNGDLDQAIGDPWYPLFPQDDQLESTQVNHSPLLPEEELEVSEQLRSSNPRRRSGTATSPPSGTHSSVAGVSSRKRDKPLPPIIVEDPNDTIAMKRARNTLAARKSRQRKMQRFEELEERIAKLEEERDHWKGIALRRTGGQ